MEFTGKMFFPKKKQTAVRASQDGVLTNLIKKLFPKKQYKNLKTTSTSKSSYFRSSANHYKSGFDKTNDNFKVFKPSNEHLIKEKVKNSISLSSVKKFAFGQKNLELITRNTSLLDYKNFVKNLNFYLVKWKIIQKFNRILAILLLLTSLIGVIYISFFDRFFLIKTYTISFSDKSYLDDKQVAQLTQKISQDKSIMVLPQNGYWFISDYNLSKLGQNISPEIKSISVINRTWPDKVELKITTEPILLTLGVMENNQKRYWRISQAGKVLSEDNLNLRENLVEVDRLISFDKPGKTLKDYPLEDNKEQQNRFWFIIWLWSVLSDLNISIVRTSLPTLLDSDVEILTSKNTRLLFDSTSITKDNQLKRIKSTLDTATNGKPVRQKLDTGLLNYIDFRIPKKVYVCDTGEDCSFND